CLLRVASRLSVTLMCMRSGRRCRTCAPRFGIWSMSWSSCVRIGS
ncbi:Transcriptional regulator, partial [Pseudomonas sp. FG-3G]